MPDVAKKDAALILWDILKKHDSLLSSFRYTKQISRAQNLLAEIARAPRNAYAVRTIAAEALLANMQTKLDKLVVGIEKRNDFKAAQPNDQSPDVENLLTTNLKKPLCLSTA